MGSLEIFAALTRPELLAETVLAALTDESVGVAEIHPSLSDTAAFCQHYGIRLDQAANCVVLEAKRADRTWFTACVILSSTRADINGVGRRALDARRASFASMEEAVAKTGMEYGAITPVGLPADWTILIDRAVADTEYVIIGSGLRKSKLVVPGHFLASLQNAMVVDGLALSRTA